jgi:hypothetical protein
MTKFRAVDLNKNVKKANQKERTITKPAFSKYIPSDYDGTPGQGSSKMKVVFSSTVTK